jgi:hypothetical protein
MTMSRISSILFLSTALSLTACSDDGSDTITPEGPKNPYVVSQVSVPTSTAMATEFGLDLDGNKVVDNALGMVLATLSGYFNVQAAITGAVDAGDIVLLMELQTKDFSSSGAVGLQVHLADTATVMPAACASTTDTVCRRHLDGSGSFAIAADSPPAAIVTGKIAGGTFNGGPGNLSLQIALGGTDAVQLDLIGARAKATGMSADKIESITLAGALTQNDLNTKVLPAIRDQILPVIADDCTMLTMPPDCGCPMGSTGKTILGLLDTTPKDCAVTLEEIQNAPLIKSLLAPDVMIEGTAALSVGVKAAGVKATLR